MTDTPIYDQVRNDLSARREPSESPGRRGEHGASSKVSVWALVDANRNTGARRRSG